LIDSKLKSENADYGNILLRHPGGHEYAMFIKMNMKLRVLDAFFTVIKNISVFQDNINNRKKKSFFLLVTITIAL
jgi:hypothetical protein